MGLNHVSEGAAAEASRYHSERVRESTDHPRNVSSFTKRVFSQFSVWYQSSDMSSSIGECGTDFATEVGSMVVLQTGKIRVVVK